MYGSTFTISSCLVHLCPFNLYPAALQFEWLCRSLKHVTYAIYVLFDVCSYMVLLKCNATHVHVCILPCMPSCMCVHLNIHFKSMQVLANITQVHCSSRKVCVYSTHSKYCSRFYALYHWWQNQGSTGGTCHRKIC